MYLGRKSDKGSRFGCPKTFTRSVLFIGCFLVRVGPTQVMPVGPTGLKSSDRPRVDDPGHVLNYLDRVGPTREVSVGPTGTEKSLTVHAAWHLVPRGQSSATRLVYWATLLSQNVISFVISRFV